MYCTSCGKEIKDDARFCSYCGGIVQQVEQAPQSAQAEHAPQAEQSNFSAQVEQSRRSSRKKMPMVLLIVVIAMLSAGVAFAAAYVYTHYIAPEPQPAQVEEVAEPEGTTYTTESFTDEAFIGVPPESQGQKTAPAFSFDLPSGWEVASDTLEDSVSATATTPGKSATRTVTIVNEDQDITLTLEIELGSPFSGLMFEGNDIVSCAGSGLGSEYAVGYCISRYGGSIYYGLFGVCEPGVGVPGIEMGDDRDYTVFFRLSEAGSVDLIDSSTVGDTYDEASAEGFWSTFDANDPKWEDAISIMSSLRVA